METKTQQKRNPAGKRHEGQLLLLVPSGLPADNRNSCRSVTSWTCVLVGWYGDIVRYVIFTFASSHAFNGTP